MSRDFTKDLANLLEIDGTGADLFDNATIITFAMWARIDTFSSGSTNNTILALPCTNSANGFIVNLTSSGGLRLNCRPVSGETNKSAVHSIGFSTGTWVHLWGATDFPGALIYTALDGQKESHAVSAWTTTNFQGGTNSGRFRIGTNATATPSSTTVATDGLLAHVAMWANVGFADEEIAALAAGVSPLRVKRTGLALYLPLWGIHSPEIELINNKQGTISGSVPAGTSEPPVRLFSDSFLDDDQSWIEVAGGSAIGAISAYHRARMAA